MNKYLKKSIIWSAMAFTFIGCEDDFTDLKPEGGTTYDNFWKTEQDAINSVNSIYDYMDDEDMFARGYFWYINASDDMVTGRTKAEADNIKNFNINGTEGYTYWMYPQSFKIIRRCNDVLFNVPNVEFEDETLKNRLLGEAYFMRAFHYFWLAHTYGDDKNGGIPIVTEENMNEPAGSFTRPSSVVENYAQLISDLEIAAEKLQYFNEMSPEDYGRPHKDAAWGYIAKAYLYWAQYDNSKYEKVIEYTQKIINSPSHRALVDTNNPKEDYRRLHSYLENWGSEYIWSVDSGLNGGSKLPGITLENKGWGMYNGWGYYMPTQELYEAFEEGDARRDVTVLAWGDTFPYFGEERVYTSENSKSGYQFNKYLYEFGLENPIGTYVNSNGDDPTTLYNVPLMRFAEVLLMQAEAKLMTGQNADIEINLVRDRAGLNPITGATMQDLKHERRVELAGEFANRHFDLVRWGDAQSVYAQPLHGNPLSPLVDDSGVIWKGRSFDPSYMNVWPIPAEVIRASGISQNQGW